MQFATNPTSTQADILGTLASAALPLAAIVAAAVIVGLAVSFLSKRGRR